tara:strand:+ start:4146 stop:4451 length:306 start_codon:yes stop_codon:yes gene_type:complete
MAEQNYYLSPGGTWVSAENGSHGDRILAASPRWKLTGESSPPRDDPAASFLGRGVTEIVNDPDLTTMDIDAIEELLLWEADNKDRRTVIARLRNLLEDNEG